MVGKWGDLYRKEKEGLFALTSKDTFTALERGPQRF
jgi:hypothetical protein